MGITDEIMEKAYTLFDVAGVVVEESGVVLILGLEHTKERNIDTSYVEDGKIHNPGWIEHVKPRMKILMDFIRERGFEAEPVGRWGYPGGDVMQLKSLAVKAGLGQRGKSTLLLNPTFGHRLRFAAMKTDAPLTPTGPGTDEHRENPMCQSCNICIDTCPVEGLLEPYRLLSEERCIANYDKYLALEGRIHPNVWCHQVCRTKCPIGSYPHIEEETKKDEKDYTKYYSYYKK